jgi:hypothetical protein
MPRERRRPLATGGLTPGPEPLMTAAPAAPTARVARQPAAPSASSGPSQSVYLSARVSRVLRDALQHQAIREARPVAPLLIDAVTAYLIEHSPPDTAVHRRR